jgi:outer membrane receptor protein involved in Fe transport
VLFDVSKRVALDVALRWDAQRFGPAFGDDQVSPRISLQYRYDPRTVARLSWGRMAQTQRPDELQVPDGDPFFHTAQRSVQTVLSVERLIRDSALLRVEVYDKHVTNPTPIYENLFDPFALLPELEADRVRVSPIRSRMHGAELSLRWQLPRGWSGWTSYSFSEATDDFDSAPSALRTWDQKHAVATGLAWTHGRWQLSGNVNWHSGWRRNVLVETDGDVSLGPRNALAWPSYISLDMRATWSRPLSRGELEVFGEIDNATNHGNLCCASYSVSSTGGITTLSPDTSTWLPRLYLVGVTWKLP